VFVKHEVAGASPVPGIWRGSSADRVPGSGRLTVLREVRGANPLCVFLDHVAQQIEHQNGGPDAGRIGGGRGCKSSSGRSPLYSG